MNPSRESTGRSRVVAALLLAGLVVGAAQCSTFSDGHPPPQQTSINGAVYHRVLNPASAAFSLDEGPPRGLLVRISTREDTCAAAADPSDGMDPNLIISLTPDQTGTFPILPPNVSTVPARYATATLFTYTDMPDGGPPDGGDAGLRPVVRNAIGGEVEVTDFDPDPDQGRLNARIVLFFADDAGYAGQVGAFPCERVR
ncbi:MAG: hypothetical protein HY904_17760 [Deltaproteobacteria bacterium]|nr:hypothetical protein [Deltaproteobacteria bacterium]